MKLIKKTIIPAVALFSLSLTGCSGFLDTTPHDSLNSDNALESMQDFDNTTNSVYESIRSASYTTEFMLMVPDVMSDNLTLNRDGRLIYNEFADFKFYADTYGVTGMWSAAYNGILGANEVITRLDGMEIAEASCSLLSSAKLPGTVPPDSMALNWVGVIRRARTIWTISRFSASVFCASSALSFS